MPSSIGPIVTVSISGASDGDASRWPQRGMRREDNVSVYLSKLATKLVKERGTFQEGRRYMLDKLPNGYALFGKGRENDPTHIDRYLYGHPTYKFRSAEEFYDHFRTLEETGGTDGCTCIGCRPGRKRGKPPGTKTVRPSQPSNASKKPPPSDQPRPRITQIQPDRNGHPESNQPVQPLRWKPPIRPSTPEHEKVDDEGTPDPYYHLIHRLSEIQLMDEPIREPQSFDWRIDRKHIPHFLDRHKTLPAFLPRIGELVLFVRNLEVSQLITLDKDQNTFRLWDSDEQVYKTMPEWEAGVVTDTPKERLTPADLVLEQAKQHQVNYSGYRIEPMSAIKSPDKHWSKRVAQVRLHEIRPFALYREILHGIRAGDYHQTVQNALVSMASVCLFEKYHFRGHWPNASVFCRGIFIGSELMLVGDTVRLVPGAAQPADQVWDAMKVTSVRLKMIHLDARDNPDYDDPTVDEQPARWYDCCIHIDGIAFTRDQSRAWGIGKLPINVDSKMLPDSIKGYGDWYHLHDPTRRWKVPFNRILGRCYESEAMKLWFSSVKAADAYKIQGFAAINAPNELPDSILPAEVVNLSQGLKGIVTARKFSKDRDTRIMSNLGKSWYWADSRVDQLDLEEIKGQVVCPILHGRATRDPKAWRRAMHIREKGAGHRSKLPAGMAPSLPVGRGRPSKMGGGSMMAASAVGTAVDAEEEVQATEDEVTSRSGSRVEEDDEADVAMQIARETKQQAVIDPNDVTVIHDDDSSEVDSEDD